jgi:hypothetical protein
MGPYDGAKGDIWALGINIFFLLFGTNENPEFSPHPNSKIILPKEINKGMQSS